ncbi:MAG: carboxypeptidase-like regulatory domain-containing protein, partial [Acidobacteriaceae bacterium]
MVHNERSSATAIESRLAHHLLAKLGLAMVLTMLLATAAWGQSQSINGTIRGRVTDTSGAAVPSASATVLNTATGFTRTVESGDDGYYVVPNLPLGPYQVTIAKAGFANLQAKGVIIQAGTEAVIDAPMKVAGVDTVVEVTGGAPLIETTVTDVGRTINNVEIENLPL